jgi:hypothetical protein
MSTVPVLGDARQAPTVNAPKVAPCVIEYQVEPNPMQAATAKQSRDPNNSRTVKLVPMAM